MDVTFKFHLGDKVIAEDGITGFVETNSISKGMIVNRVLVSYVTKDGEKRSDWYDEDDLMIDPDD